MCSFLNEKLEFIFFSIYNTDEITISIGKNTIARANWFALIGCPVRPCISCWCSRCGWNLECTIITYKITWRLIIKSLFNLSFFFYSKTAVCRNFSQVPPYNVMPEIFIIQFTEKQFCIVVRLVVVSIKCSWMFFTCMASHFVLSQPKRYTEKIFDEFLSQNRLVCSNHCLNNQWKDVL